MKIKPELIVFDLDGVLVDSEIIGHRINADELSRLGYPLTIEQSIELLTGITKTLFDKIMLQKYGETISNADLMPILKKIDEEITTTVKPISGIMELLDHIDQSGIAKCIVTNSANNYAVSVLKRTHLDNYFELDQIFSASMVNHYGKPAPDVFLLAAHHYQVNPQACLVIEDSVYGIQGAKAANMPVIGFLGGSHAQSFSYHQHILKTKPMLIVDSSSELSNLLKNFIT